MQQRLKKIKEHPKIQKVLLNKKFQKYEKWVLVILWAAGIYFISSQSLNDFFIRFDFWHFIIRKIAHIFEFGVLTFLIFRILGQTEKRHIYWNMFWAFIFTTLYAVSDEYHQYLVPGRFGLYSDVLIDMIGIIIATWLIYLYYHHEKIRKIKYKKIK